MSVARGYPNAGHFYSNIVKPIKIDLNYIVDATNGLGIRSLKSNGYVRNVFMHTSTTPASNDGYLNPNPANGYALIQMKQNFNKFLGGFTGFVSPVTGSNINIADSAVLTVGNPYVITAVGTVPAPQFTVVCTADTAGSLASKYFTLSDAYGNNYVIYFIVSGVGQAPSLTGSLSNYVAVPVSIASGAANTAVASAVETVLDAINGGASFAATRSTATLTVVSQASPDLQLSPLPAAQTSGFTVSAITYTSLAADWQSVGVPPGITPAVGMSFIATATGSALGSGTVKAPGVSGITSIEVIGDVNASINNSSIAVNGGAWLLVQFLKPAFTGSALGTHTHDLTVIGGQAASTTNNVAVYPTNILGKEAATNATIAGADSGTKGGVVAASAGTPAGSIAFAAGAPAAGTEVSMSFFFDGSNVTVDGL